VGWWWGWEGGGGGEDDGSGVGGGGVTFLGGLESEMVWMEDGCEMSRDHRSSQLECLGRLVQ